MVELMPQETRGNQTSSAKDVFVCENVDLFFAYNFKNDIKCCKISKVLGFYIYLHIKVLLITCFYID